MYTNLEEMQAAIRELQLRDSERASEITGLRTELGAGGTATLTNFKPTVVSVAPQAVNQIRNGELGHSVNTWNEAAPDAGDKSKECAHWFTHDAPTAAQQLDKSTSFADLNIDADANVATNKALKESSHSTYSASFCKWDRTHGIAQLQGTKTLDAPFPSNIAGADTAVQCVSFIFALLNSYIVVPAGFRLFAGIWDNTAGQRNWLPASSAFALTGFVEGVPGATTERRYKILAYTDRGYTFLSTELTLAGAPADGSFISNQVGVRLSWERIEGVLTYKIYRYNVVAGTYEYIDEKDNGDTTFIDYNPSSRKAAGGYPVATDDRAKSYVATPTNALEVIAIDGVSAKWDEGFLNIPVPKNYNKGNTTAEQWLRIGQNMALDRQVVDAVVNNGSANLDSATAAFTTHDTGRSVTITAGANTHTTTITYVDADSVTLAAPWPHASATSATLLITGGGDHGLLIDKIHMSYTPGAVFAPYPEDLNRPQQPNAAPSSSSQGGVGTGGGLSDPGEGGVACVEEHTPITLFLGADLGTLPFRDVPVGAALASGNLLPNFVQKKRREWCDNLWLIETENGIELPCSPSHRVITSVTDTAGHAAQRLITGDYVLTGIGTRIERSRIQACGFTGQGGWVGTFVGLAPGRIYIAGRRKRPSLIMRIIQRIRGLFGGRPEPAGILSHNRKVAENNPF
jgi:hypothetical protein